MNDVSFRPVKVTPLIGVNMAVAVFNNLTRLSRCKGTNYRQIIRHYSNVKYTKSSNSFKLLGVLSGGLAALSYLKWQNTTVVQAFNPKKMKVGRGRSYKKF